MAYDPAASQLHWVRGGWGFNAEPHLVLVDCTVDINEPEPGTETLGESWVQDDGCHVIRVGKPVTHRLRLLTEAKNWTIHPRANESVTVLAEHHERCGGCGELWPCRDDRMERAAERLTRELDDMCAHCGKPIGSAWMESFNDGVTSRRYHTALKYRANGKTCRAALAEARASLPGVTS